MKHVTVLTDKKTSSYLPRLSFSLQNFRLMTQNGTAQYTLGPSSPRLLLLSPFHSHSNSSVIHSEIDVLVAPSDHEARPPEVTRQDTRHYCCQNPQVHNRERQSQFCPTETREAPARLQQSSCGVASASPSHSQQQRYTHAPHQRRNDASNSISFTKLGCAPPAGSDSWVKSPTRAARGWLHTLAGAHLIAATAETRSDTNRAER